MSEKKKVGNPGTQRVAPENQKKPISTRLDPHLKKRLDEYCKKTGIKQTWIFEHTLEKYLTENA